ncbi:hypothetical protein ACQJBY_072095 [Aegilops geniculata]
MCTLFILWSAYSGQPNIDTPAMIPTSTEFHPHGPVVDHVHLRCPPLDVEPAAVGSLHEPLRQKRMEVRVVVVDTLGVSYHRHLQPDGDLPDLLLRVAHLSYAPEAEEPDAAVWLPWPCKSHSSGPGAPRLQGEKQAWGLPDMRKWSRIHWAPVNKYTFSSGARSQGTSIQVIAPPVQTDVLQA